MFVECLMVAATFGFAAVVSDAEGADRLRDGFAFAAWLWTAIGLLSILAA